MIASSWWKVGLGMAGVLGVLASSGTGCGSGTSSTGSTTGESTTSAGGGTSGTGGATAGTGGDAATTATGTTTTTGTTSTTTSGTTSSTGTGMSPYADCEACTETSAGAPAKECKTSYDACNADANCKTIYDCVYDPNTGCPTDASGACCTFDCYDQLKAKLGNTPAGMAAAQKAIDAYGGYSNCLYCTTCKDLCSADAYCTAYAAGQAACTP
jgi:hypothetical protein